MSEDGWVKLSRRMKKWEWKTDPNMVALWVHLLLHANYEFNRFMGHDVPVGSLVTGIHTLSKSTGLTVSQTRTCLERLKMTNEIAIKTTAKFSIISIVKWEEFQSDRKVNRKRIASSSQADDYTIRNKEIKNIDTPDLFQESTEEEKPKNPEDCPITIDPKLWADFLKHRKAKRLPITERALKGIYEEAEKAGMSPSGAIEIMLKKGWGGFEAVWLTNIERKPAKENVLGPIDPDADFKREIFGKGWGEMTEAQRKRLATIGKKKP